MWKSKVIGETTKIRLFNTNVTSVLRYGTETWRINNTTLIRIQTFVNHWLQRILRIHWMDRVSNKDLWDRTHQAQIEIVKKRWGWLGHTSRKPSTNITRQVLCGTPVYCCQQGLLLSSKGIQLSHIFVCLVFNVRNVEESPEAFHLKCLYVSHCPVLASIEEDGYSKCSVEWF